MDGNQRRYPRQAAHIIARYKVIEGAFQDVITNISAGGLSVRTHRRIAVGQPISIEFPLFDAANTIDVTGRVVRNDTAGFAVTFNEPIHGLICKAGRLPEIVHEDAQEN